MRKTQRRSRWNDADALDKPCTVMPRDVEIFQLLNPDIAYTYLPSSWLFQLLGGGTPSQFNSFTSRLGILAREPNSFLLRPAQQRESLNASFKHQVYRLAEKGEQHLFDRGVISSLPIKRRDPYKHRLGADIAMASLRLGAADHFLSFNDLCELGVIPQHAWNAPCAIPIAGDTIVEPDGLPFAVRNNSKVRYVLALEFDRDTTDKTGGGRDTVHKKFSKYRALFEQRVYSTFYNFDNAVVLCVSTSARGLERMKKVVHGHSYSVWSLNDKPPSWLWFSETQDWATAPRFPKPSGFLFDAAWSRVGHPNIKIGEF